jgi:hypothetical protein
MDTQLQKLENFVIFQSEEGKVNIDVFFADETLWLTQKGMSELFDTSKQNISLHLKNIFSEDELVENSVVKEFLTTANDGKSYKTLFYSLDVIIATGYRVNSNRATKFRIWATQVLQSFIISSNSYEQVAYNFEPFPSSEAHAYSAMNSTNTKK